MNKLFLVSVLLLAFYSSNAQIDTLKSSKFSSKNHFKTPFAWPNFTSEFIRFEKHLTLNPTIATPFKFEASKLPIFCKIEHQLQSQINVPIRFRLGSLDYVNQLEGK